jgi:hypothetical protein
VDIDDVGLRIEMIVPDMLQQHRAGNHMAGVVGPVPRRSNASSRASSSLKANGLTR